MKTLLNELVELNDQAAAHCHSRWGRVVRVNADSVFIETKRGEEAWFVPISDIVEVYIPKVDRLAVTTFFVKDGNVNGVEGERATTAGFGEQLEDGWYFLIDGEADGHGPFASKDEASAAAEGYQS